MQRRNAWLLGAFGAGLLGIVGCGSDVVSSLTDASEPLPIREDWLVVRVPAQAQQPSAWFKPGYPPLSALDKPFDTLQGDDALLVPQVKLNNILNTRKLPEESRQELRLTLKEFFGTPSEPKFNTAVPQKLLDDQVVKQREKLPGITDATAKKIAEKDLADKIESANALRTIATDLHLDDATLKQGQSLYNNYCAQCHGVTGNGAGPGGSYFAPAPRDYRPGIFKFISSEPTIPERKPRRSDLYRTIAQGINSSNGSAMPNFGGLNDKEIDAIISYVTFLSIRGEAEYKTLIEAMDPREGLSSKEFREAVLRNISLTAPRWSISDRKILNVDPNPYLTEAATLNSAVAGQKLFVSTEGACTTCHIGYGKNSPYQYDSWGTIVKPRNLFVAALRGGRKPEEIYARIAGGIQGSNMPAHPQFRPNDQDRLKGTNRIWDLVNFVLYLSESDKRAKLEQELGIKFDE